MTKSQVAIVTVALSAVALVAFLSGRATSTPPLSKQDYVEAGKSKCHRLDWRGAEGEFTRAIEIEPKDAALYNLRGTARSSFDTAGAFADYETALALNPAFASVYNNRGSMRINLKDYAGAVNDFTKSLALQTSVIAFVNRAQARMQLAEWENAARDFEQGLAIAPENWNMRPYVFGLWQEAKRRQNGVADVTSRQF